MIRLRVFCVAVATVAVSGQLHAESARQYCLEQFPAQYYSKEDHDLYIKECIEGQQGTAAGDDAAQGALAAEDQVVEDQVVEGQVVEDGDETVEVADGDIPR